MARLVLIGPPTAGKTTVGRLLGQRWGVPFVDVDQVIEADAGLSVADIFAQQGESAFRALEAAAVPPALGSESVVALGGGAVTQPSAVDWLAHEPVVWLDVPVEVAARRASDEPGRRPLLQGDVGARLTDLDAQRRGLYAGLATWRVDASQRTPAQVADAVDRLAGGPGADIEFATQHHYGVTIRHGARARLAAVVAGAARVAVIASPNLAGHAAAAADEIAAAGATPCHVEVPDGEAAKTPAVLADCWSALARHGLTRSDLVVGVGGGATTDLAGFVAAGYLRGIGWVAVPTSVLGMVDAAIGGKTGIDLPEGKNLVGAFHEPRAVLADLDTLVTLPAAEVPAGLAEAVKEGFTDDAAILDLVEADPPEALAVTSDRLAQIVARAVAVKARVVADDLRERTSVSGGVVGRERLNYGHTLAHAIETHENYAWRHGEAVAMGCVFAAEVAHRVLGLPAGVVERHRAVFASLELPTTYRGAAWDDLRPLMGRDKKARGSHLRMVLLRNVGDVTVVMDPPEDALRDAFAAIARP